MFHVCTWQSFLNGWQLLVAFLGAPIVKLLSSINIFFGPLNLVPDLRQIGEELHAMIKKLITEELNSAKQQQVSGGPMALKFVVMGSNLA